VVFSGVSVQRSRLSNIPSSLFDVKSSTLEMISCLVNNDGGLGSCIWASQLAAVYLMSCSVKGGSRAGIALMASELVAFFSNISHNGGKGVSLFRSCAFLEDCYLSSNFQGAVSLAYNSSAALSHCDVRKNGSRSFMVGAGDISIQSLEYEEGDCSLYSRECTGDDRSMSEWLSKKKGKFRWIDQVLNTDQLTCNQNDTAMDISTSPEKSLSVGIAQIPLSLSTSGVDQAFTEVDKIDESDENLQHIDVDNDVNDVASVVNIGDNCVESNTESRVVVSTEISTSSPMEVAN